ncbi:hypothetical protein EK21DRAFT_85977 [Setomelanomma holmii]|uniref:Uncharacterized protein n=1 Tax=Setomelanomma holmii TaxID=210430 RepID=A0A9P4HEU8_9PLEO|nr:hypothetical protein EK21DRAFT_85977 [Setomelanomma holmii]
MCNQYTNITTAAENLLADQVEHLVVAESGKGFFDLPGEIRNKSYEFTLSDWLQLKDAVAIASFCRQIRLEYRSFYFERARIGLQFYEAQPFLETFFPIDSPEVMNKYKCNLRPTIAAGNHPGDPVIDMQWLLKLLLDCPWLDTDFYSDGAFDCEARDLDKPVSIARSTPV